ncbi:MAG: hypothetical protein DRP63_02690 [Planctomycetota bacterium]|nr:MAG: hypothetical protein DRP63_02690 [Planctomycetota bacterium]
MRCVNHPNREAYAFCQKYSRAYCRECCKCPDPKSFCKFRKACLVWALCEKGKKTECCSSK